jgi:hypothetical protein
MNYWQRADTPGEIRNRLLSWAVFSPMGFFDFFRRRRMRDRVIFTDASVTHIRADGIEEIVGLDDLQEVDIITTDEGPWWEDVYFLLISSDGKSGCAVPQCSEGCDRFLARLQQLPGFDNATVIKAMGSTSNATFVCWKR